ncbi:ABC transporter substrate-binding protein [Fictibacillus phosphorivorans]|uniref:ABC transporter substrate-binding protein n=1 Tax=Fictibacillus phosphorivorans TaxID=1221500 RepID=UPI00203D2350|nr:iron-siderophore ABC transporter substrate-binding protein [Fictibacillus phosphorivorans]MCM3718605.1 iron-siderophore ABC transporter substrate-binding protein [Fictibacillus phosphorivorans]MCM3776228.1 iron-siderophore ABC transporter substrate-binding protein [Fictibacillus phosphorivorans]
MKKTTYKWLAFAALLTLMLALAACGGKDKETEGAKSDGSKDSSYKVEHAMGTAEVKSNKRVVVLTNEGTEAVLALGVKPVGAVKSWLGDPWYDHIKDDMEGVEVVGDESAVNIEKVMALKPDLIIGNKMRQEKQYDELNKIAPTVFAEDLRGDWKINFELYSKALNKEEKGKEVLAAFDKRIEDFKAEAGDKLKTEVSMVRFMPGKSRIYHQDSFSGVILKQIGFARPGDQNKPDFAEEVTQERIPDMDGDMLFYFTYETGDGEATATEKEWTNNPLWKNLGAVKEGNAHKVSDAIWNTAGGVKAANLMLDDLEKYFLEK